MDMNSVNKRVGLQTVILPSKPAIVGTYSIVGPKEGQGPLKSYFDEILDDVLFGEKSWEKAESKMQNNVVTKACNNSAVPISSINYICSGDLLNQITAACYGIKDLNVPFLGLYGACSTMAESLSIAGMLVDGGFAKYVLASTSSHFCSAEKQFRGPLELGSQRPPTSQWTVTGAGASIVSSDAKLEDPRITFITTGKPMDFGINDANNMGAAMAPAALDTIITHLKDTNREPKYYDLIVTGDLGKFGKEIVIDLAKRQEYDLERNYTDCGVEIFDCEKQEVDMGGSGCGCSGAVLNSYIIKKLRAREINKVLFVATGALMSPLCIQQGESIVGIAHAVAIENINI